MALWKRRGTTSSLDHTERRERDLIAYVEQGIDEGIRTGGLIEEIIYECRARAVLHAQDSSWRFLLGRFLMAAGEPLDARDELEAAAVLNPRDPRIAAHLALWYKAAFVVASGDPMMVELPAGCGPEVTVDVVAFAQLDEQMSQKALASRVMDLIDATLEFSLRGSDVRMLKKHRASVMLPPLEGPSAAPVTLTSLSRAS